MNVFLKSKTRYRCAIAVLVVGLMMLGEFAPAQEADPTVVKPAPPAPTMPVTSEISAAEQKIYAALVQPTELDFVETPFSDVIVFLSDKHEIPIVIDTRALDANGIGSGAVVTMQLKGVPLRTALRHMLGTLDLTYTVRDEILLVTTEEEADAVFKVRVYQVDDLVRDDSPLTEPDRSKADPDSLSEAVVACIDLRRRSAVSLVVLNENLIVRAGDQVQFDVQAALDGFREAKHLLATDPKAAFARPIALTARSRSAGYMRVAAELDHETHLEFIEKPLSDVIADLTQRHKIPILLDDRALDGVGIGSDTPITQSLKGISLRSSLNLMLKELELTWVIDEGVLVITTIEQAELQWLPEGFVVRDLADVSGSTVQDYDSLIEMVTTTVMPQTWSETWTLDCSLFEPADLMIFAQSSEGHREIASLFASMRQAPEAHAWSVDDFEADWEAYRNTPTLQRFHFSPFDEQMPTVGGIEPEQVRTYLQRAFSAEDLQERSFHFGESHFSLFLTPPETLDLLRKFDKAGLPISHSDPFFAGGFTGGGFF